MSIQQVHALVVCLPVVKVFRMQLRGGMKELFCHETGAAGSKFV